MNNNGQQFPQNNGFQQNGQYPSYNQTPPPQKKKLSGCAVALIALAVMGFLLFFGIFFVSCAAGIAGGRADSDEVSRNASQRDEEWSQNMEELQSDLESAQEALKDELSKAFNGDESSLTSESTSEDLSEIEESSEPSETSEEMINGMRKSFVEAMDSYEAFFDEYVEFMQKYMNNPTDLSLLLDYYDFIEKCAEYEDKLDSWEDKEMNDTERSYYLKVQARVSKKMATVAIDGIYGLTSEASDSSETT